MTNTSTAPLLTGSPIDNPDDLHRALDTAHHPPEKLGMFLLRRGLISEQNLGSALRIKAGHPERRLGEILVAEHLLQPHTLALSLSHLMGIPFVHLAAFEIQRDVVALLAPSLAHRYGVVPLTRHRDGLVLACAEPPDHNALQDIAFHTGTFIFLVMATPEEIHNAIFLHYDSFAEDVAAADSIISKGNDAGYIHALADAEYLAKQAPIVRLVASILTEAIRRRASDVHLRPGPAHVDLLYRLDGTLVRIKRMPIHMLPPLVSRIKILSQLDITERRVPQDGHLKADYLQSGVDVRVSIIPTSHGESVVLRILDKQAGLRDVHNIGFTARDEERFLDLIHRSKGMLPGPVNTIYKLALESVFAQRSLTASCLPRHLYIPVHRRNEARRVLDVHERCNDAVMGENRPSPKGCWPALHKSCAIPRYSLLIWSNQTASFVPCLARF